jgi:hypothetical protein
MNRAAKAGALLVLMCFALTCSTAAAQTVTYSATETIPVPPASSYAGSGGGDGWAIATTPTAVYNVFHHAAQLQVACHLQADASACWTPKTITDAGGGQFAVSGHPGLTINHDTGHLYVYATRSTDDTGGVVCVDTTQPASNTNPFCGFTTLTAVGDAPVDSGISAISDPVKVGSRWYAFNFVNGSAATGDHNGLLCFDLSTSAACAGQPYAMGLGGATVTAGSYPPPAVAAIAGRVIVPYNGDQLACLDTNTGNECAGTWPASVGAYASSAGTAFPMMNDQGTVTGFCLPIGTDPCFTLAGASVSTPAGMSGAITPNTGWNGPAFVLGPRIYVANGNVDTVQCFDYATSESCANFPRSFSNLSFMYTVNPDAQRPTCVWVNADSGSEQIQNFDAYTGGPCGEGPIRVLASSLVAPTETCVPANYTSLQVTDPPRSTYASGNVAFQDGDANPVPGLADMPLNASGAVDLSRLDLNTQHGLPQFLITLNGAAGTPGEVTVRLTWTGVYDTSCVKSGIQVTSAPGGGTTPASPNVNPCTIDGISCPPLKGTFGWGWHNAGKDFTLGWVYGGKHRYLGNIWQAATNWNDTGTRVHFTRLPDGVSVTDHGVTITDVPTLNGYWGVTGFPKPHDCSSCTYHRTGVQLAQDTLDGESDFIRTKVTTHELGHALALRHPIEFGITTKSVMNPHELPYNKPQPYDVKLLRELYP